MVKNTRLGKLYIVSTPIGNLKDISQRSLDALKEADFCLVEDTRVTKKLLNHYQIQTKNRLISYHKFSEKKKLKDIILKLSSGKDLALVSDAGTPLISDPGSLLVREVVSLGSEIVVCPGPSAVITALTVSGFNLDKFSFYGFSPSKDPEREEFFKILGSKNETVVFFETSRNLAKTLSSLNKIMPTRELCICREMTKLYESYYRGISSELIEMMKINENMVKGEIAIVLSDLEEKKIKKESLSLEEIRIVEMISEFLPKKEASKLAAKMFKRSKKDFYDFLSK